MNDVVEFPEWIIAGAAVTMVLVTGIGYLWNHHILNEMKKSRDADALPILEFGATWASRTVYFVVKNIGNGIARNIEFTVTFEGYDQQEPIKDNQINISPQNQEHWSINMIPEYLTEHGSTVTMKIKCEFEDVYSKKFKISKEQSLNQKIFSNK